MATLNPKPGSSSKIQHQTLVIEAKRKGVDLSELRSMVGGSLRKLSAAECSSWITRFSGRDLPNPPGQKPRTYTTRAAPGTTRMITQDQCDQITRLMLEYFEGDAQASTVWLRLNFKVDTRRELATARRGGEVIAVLKEMLKRRDLSRAAVTAGSQPKGPSHAL